jgi:hypothetical protein
MDQRAGPFMHFGMSTNLDETRVTIMVMPRVAWASDQWLAVLNRTVGRERILRNSR